MSRKTSLSDMLCSAAFLSVLFAGAVCADELTKRKYAAAEGQKGVVLLGVNWGRAGNYCGFENVRLQSLSFDRLPITHADDSSPGDVRLKGPKLTAEPVSVTYALLLDPGEYALTEFHIKAAKSVNDVGAFGAGRSRLIKDGQPLAGSFDVAAGEIVYIGNSAPDCPELNNPVVWRYYLKDRTSFTEFLANVKNDYPFLDADMARFRLFQTITMGNDFELPAD